MRLRRIPSRMWVSYLALVGAIFLVLTRLPPPDELPEGPAIPAFAGRVAPAPGRGAEGPFSSTARRFIPSAGWLRNRLGEGMPAYGAFVEAQPRAGGAGATAVAGPSPAWWRVLGRLAYQLTGVDPARPVSALGAGLPVFAMRAPDEGEIEVDVPPARLQFDPARRIGGPPRPGETPVVPPEQFGDRPVVGVYSTHHFESFVSELPKKPDAAGDVAVYDDNRRNVVAVAGELARTLSERYGIAAVHSPARHDVGGYGLSYDYSRVTAQRMLKEFPSIRVLVDVHRDSTPRNADTVKRVREETYAGIRIVVGRGNPASRTYSQPNYPRTRAFAEALFGVMDELYPGLKRDVFERDARYNQDLLPGAILIEIGGPENTMEEALRSARAVAHVLAEALRRGLVPR